jgi:carboxyl-terminal processing protease
MDGTTSGAAEVLASAMVTAHRGDVVGERTFGLASEQKLITIPDGSALILTVANYYNAGGKSILEEGVTPAEVVRQEATAQDDGADDDDSSASAAQTTAPAEPKPLSPEDAVFKKAVELLKTPAKKAA